MNISYHILSFREFIFRLREIYHMTKSVNEYYYGYKKWLWKVAKGIITNKREVIVALDHFNNIVGITILKKSPTKKICNLYVRVTHRNQGIGSTLLFLARSHMGSDSFIMIPHKLIDQYITLMKKNNASCFKFLIARPKTRCVVSGLTHTDLLYEVPKLHNYELN